MADELKIGDVVYVNGTNDPIMVVANIIDSTPKQAECIYLNRLTATFTYYKFPIPCLTKKK